MKLLLNFNKKGFTLIEVILGIALIGIISVSIIPLFTFGVISNHRSGDRTETLYDIQKTIENNKPATPTKQQLSITFDNKEVDIDINTFEVEVEDDKTGKKESIFFFEADLEDF